MRMNRLQKISKVEPYGITKTFTTSCWSEVTRVILSTIRALIP